MTGGSALGPGKEFDRIRAILAVLGDRAGGTGDDCVIVPDGAGALVLSTDLSIEEVHFRTEWLGWREIGWRAGAGALSDLAAAGASVVGVLVSLASPGSVPADASVELMAGIGDVTSTVGGVVLGGDLARADRWVVNVTVVGRALRPVRRRGAVPGDGLWVTGRLGGAGAALQAWLGGSQPSAEARRAFAHPEPRIALGQALAGAGARAMIDLSDGLGGDAGHLAAASGCRLAIDLGRIPVHPAARSAAGVSGQPPGVFACRGGEDYELLAAMPPRFSEADAAALAREAGVEVTRVGEVLAGAGAVFRLDGAEVPLGGYDHFA